MVNVNVYIRKRKVKGGVVWAVSIETDDPRTGEKRERESGRFRTRREAAAARTKILSEAGSGTLVDPSKGTVAELLDDWMQSEVIPGRRGTTSDRYRYVVKGHLVPGLGRIGVQALTPTQVQQFYTLKRAEGTGARTIAFCHQCLHQALDMAVRHGKVARNVTDAVTRPRYDPKDKEVWSQDQLSRFLAQAEESGYGPVWLFLALTGVRRGEVLGLRWRDVDLESGIISIAQAKVQRDHGMETSGPKTAKGRRTIVLRGTLADALRRHRARQNERRLAAGEVWRDHDLIFCSEVGTPIMGSNLWRQYKRVAERAGVPHISIHGIRHTLATFLIASGEDPRTVADLLGHARTSVTVDTYSHVMPHRKHELARSIERLVMGGE